jgi:uncharacterized cupin superfamily protein
VVILENALRDGAIANRFATSNVQKPVAGIGAEHAQNPYGLKPAPIVPAWVTEGNPIARNKLLSGSTDDSASTYMWDCTAGKFTWYYHIDETIHVVEGSVVIVDEAGVSRTLKVGDTFLLPAGTRFDWTVEKYIRKIAFMHVPLPRSLKMLKRAVKALRRLVKPGSGSADTPSL